MKKNLLLFTICLICIKVFSQATFNRAYHQINESAVPFLFEINGDTYFATTIGYGVGAILYRHSNNGSLKLRSSSVNLDHISQAIKTNDNKLLFVGSRSQCDVPMPHTNFICKIDTNLAQVFLTTYTLSMGQEPRAVLQHSDSTYFTFTDSVLIRHSKTGQFMTRINTGLTNISSAILAQSGNMILSAMLGGTPMLVELSPSGSVLSSKFFPLLLNKLAFYGGQKIMGLNSYYELHKISANLDEIGYTVFSEGSVCDFVCKNDTIYSVLMSNNQPPSYIVTDTSFYMLHSSTTTTDKISQKAICLTPSKVAILSTGLSRIPPNGNEVHNFASLSVINKSSSNNFTSDLALTSVEADSSYMTCNTYTLPITVNVCTSHLRPRIKVKNMGITTIHSFKLNCYYTLSQICGGPIFYQEQFSGLSLQPGDSITLTATGFAPKYLDVVSTPTTAVNYCFYITLPNGETDKTLADNESCKPFSFVRTSVSELEEELQMINVFPNPFGSSISVESTETIYKVVMTDALGRSIHGFNVNNKQAIFDTTDLSAGIYLIKVDTGKGTSVKKVVRN